VGEGLTQEQREELEALAIGGVSQPKQGKKLFKVNMAGNSDEFK